VGGGLDRTRRLALASRFGPEKAEWADLEPQIHSNRCPAGACPSHKRSRVGPCIGVPRVPDCKMILIGLNKAMGCGETHCKCSGAGHLTAVYQPLS